MPSRSARSSSTHFSSVAPEDDESMRTASVEAIEIEDPKYTLASHFLATMMREIILDTALHAHRAARRRRGADGTSSRGCPVCGRRCQATFEHVGESEAQGTSNVGEAVPDAPEVSSLQPKGLEIYHNNPLLTCLVCSRQVSANRYAQHLASCVGVGKGGLARRKGKVGGTSKVKTALENRRRAGYLMSGTSTPMQRTYDDAMSATSDDDTGRKKSNLSHSFTLNGNGKRSASPMDYNGSKMHKPGTPPRSTESSGRSQILLGVSNHSASLPIAASPLNPLRNGARAISLVDDDDDDDYEGESEEGEVKDAKQSNRIRTTSIVSGAGSSDVYVQETASEQNYDSDDDEGLVQSKLKRTPAASDFAHDTEEDADDDDEDDDDEEQDDDDN